MSASYLSDYARDQQRKILWDKTRTKAASLLALGYPKIKVADEVGVHRNTIAAWAEDPEFAEEVDRLSMMTGAANRAERLRVAMRFIRSRMDEDGIPQSEKDVLEWLKFAQSETHGARLDFGKLAELLAGENGGDNDARQQQLAPAIDVTAISSGTGEALSDGVITGDDDDGEALNPS